MKNIFKEIEDLRESYFKIWEDVSSIESPTSYKDGVDRVGNYFVEIARKHSWKVEYSKQKVSGDVICITMNPDIDLEPVTISGHIDTVHSVGSFGNPVVRRDKEKIYGPGVADCKGGLVAGLMAMEALNKCNFKRRPVQLLIQTDEETSSMQSNKATIKYICKKAKNSIAFINMERYTAGEMCLQRKGIINFLFTITGVEAHASKCAVSGSNAIMEAANKILEIEKIKEDDGITCCCSIIEGGSSVNTVPGNCTFKVNVRFSTHKQQEWIKKRMQEIAGLTYVPGCKTVLTELTSRVAMELSQKNVALFKKINYIFEQNGLPVLKASKRTGGSDASDVTAYGIPCVDSLGVCGENIHTVEEYAYLDSLLESAKRLATVIYNI